MNGRKVAGENSLLFKEREREREKAMMVGLRCANICVCGRRHQEILATECALRRKLFGQVLFESVKRTSFNLCIRFQIIQVSLCYCR